MFTRVITLKNPKHRNEARDIIQYTCIKCKNYVLDVDVGWERSEPIELHKYLLPVSAATLT